MAETQKVKLDLEEFDIKDEKVSIKEEILPFSTAVEDTSDVDTDIKGKLEINWKLYIFLQTMKCFT